MLKKLSLYRYEDFGSTSKTGNIYGLHAGKSVSVVDSVWFSNITFICVVLCVGWLEMEHVDKRYWTLLNALMTMTGFISGAVCSLSGSRFQSTSQSVMRSRFHILQDR